MTTKVWTSTRFGESISNLMFRGYPHQTRFPRMSASCEHLPQQNNRDHVVLASDVLAVFIDVIIYALTVDDLISRGMGLEVLVFKCCHNLGAIPEFCKNGLTKSGESESHDCSMRFRG